MLTGIHIRNFKKLRDVEIELGQAVVLIGPNNSGKTAALQALALWDVGLRRWNEKKKGRPPSEERVGVAVNRRDLLSIPVPSAKLLWSDLHVRNVERVSGRQQTQNVRIEIIVDGITDGKPWSCGLEFDYANEESFICRPLRLSEGERPPRMEVPGGASDIRVAFLPPMSGLADREFIKQQGEVGVLIGQGQTAQVLRNLCYQIYSKAKNISAPTNGLVVRDARRSVRPQPAAPKDDWDALVEHIQSLFGVKLLAPVYVNERSELTMSYEENGVELDLSSSGRGLQQTLLLLAHLYANPRSVLLLDEPDAHLEMLRQQQTYERLTVVAQQQASQIIAASHSEVVLREAAGRDIVIAFLGRKPHRIDDRGRQLLKSLRDIGFDHYYLAEQQGWVLYLEGSTDLAMLQAFAERLEHPARKVLERPFVHYVGNLPQRARDHFFGLKEACPELRAVAIFDRLTNETLRVDGLKELMWSRRELENYLATKDVLLAYAQGAEEPDLFSQSGAERRVQVMTECIEEIAQARETLGEPSVWSPDIKASDEFLDKLFVRYFKKLDLPNLMNKSDYHVLAHLVPKDKIDPEIIEKLDAIVEVAKQAKPAEE
jgi:ABC-type taurine transport system ATPase subunit